MPRAQGPPGQCWWTSLLPASVCTVRTCNALYPDQVPVCQRTQWLICRRDVGLLIIRCVDELKMFGSNRNHDRFSTFQSPTSGRSMVLLPPFPAPCICGTCYRLRQILQLPQPCRVPCGASRHLRDVVVVITILILILILTPSGAFRPSSYSPIFSAAASFLLQ